jgi:CHAT domain-containing protein/Tfp pilus assembly protein PilF
VKKGKTSSADHRFLWPTSEGRRRRNAIVCATLILCACLSADERAIPLEAGQFYSAIVEAKGAEFFATLYSPDGKLLARDSHRVFTVAQSSGSFRLEIVPAKNAPADGSYALQTDGPRQATQQDQKRIQALALFMEAQQIEKPATPEVRRQAILRYETALQMWRAASDSEGEGNSLTALGRDYLILREPAKATEFFKQALPLEIASGNVRAQLDALRGLGLAYDSLQEYEQSIAYQLQAIDVARHIGQKFEEGILRNNLGNSYWVIGEETKALDSLGLALKLRTEISDQLGIAYTLQTLASVYSSMGNPQKALDSYAQALPIWQAEKNKAGEANTLNNIGYIHAGLGDPKKALDYYGRALEMWRQLKSQAGEAMTTNNVGLAYAQMHQPADALTQYQRGLATFEGVNDRRSQAYALQNIGDAQADLGNYRRAVEYYEKSRQLKRAIGDRPGESYTLQSLGDAYRALGDLEKAAGYYRDALRIRQATGDRAGEALTHAAMARVLRDRGDLNDARGEIETALMQIEALRTSLISQDLRVSYFASRRSYYDFYIDLLMRLGYPGLALEASERARARSLLDTLGEISADIRQGVDAALLERERSLHGSINAEAQRLTQLESSPNNGKMIAKSRKRLQEFISRYEDTQTSIRAASPRYAALTQPEPLALDEIQKQVLDDDTLVLEFSLGPEHSYGWVVGSNSVRGFQLPPGAEVEELSRRLYEVLLARSSNDDTLRERRNRLARNDAEFEKLAGSLSRILLVPAAGDIRGKRRLLIVCNGALQYVPFGALPDPLTSSPLIANHEIVSLPSASVLAVLRRELAQRPKPAGTLAILADPVYDSFDVRVAPSKINVDPPEFTRLQFSRREAEAIAAVAAGGKNLVALDFDANRGLVQSGRLGGYDYIHFATHAVIDSEHPELSGIVLSLVDRRGKAEDGFLRMLDIYNLKLNADLVTLSACRTALGKDIAGEGLVGLTRGFFYAGASRVLATLWSVDDKATSELMRQFYTGIFKQKLSPASALRAAQLSMWHDKQWRSPYYWGAFTLQGEWR